MTMPDDVTVALREGGFGVTATKTLAQGGTQFRCSNGAIVNIFSTGTIQYQGKNVEPVKACIETALGPGDNARGRQNGPSPVVFVVYGHNDVAKVATEAMLRRWGFQPVLLDQIPVEGLTLIEKLESYSDMAGFAVVLATADDVYLLDDDVKEFRARQNVVLELGMMLRHLGRSRVAILYEDKVGMRKPTDIDGLEYIPFTADVQEASLHLAKMMANLGYKIDLTKV